MKKIFLYAYDRVNFGDDLFIRTIANRYPDVKFYLWSKKYNIKTFSDVKNLKVVPQDSKKLGLLTKIRPSLFSRYKSNLERKCDGVVYIGGSIFIEYDNWEQILTWWDWEAKNRNFYILGANFGPYKTEAYKDKLAKVLNNVSDICFRDTYSKNIFENVSTVRYAPDILFGQRFNSYKSKKQIFVSAIDCSSRDSGLDALSNKNEQYLKLMVNYINKYINMGYTVILSSFCDIEKDNEAIDRILPMLDNRENVTVLNYNGTNSNELLKAINESELVIASRFHASILGFAAGKPVLPIVYSDKTINVLKDMHFIGKYIDIRLLNDNDVNSLIEIDDNQKLKNLDYIKKESEKHFEKLDLLLR